MKVKQETDEAKTPPKVEEVVPQVGEDGYIDYKVDFNENLSEAESNSWCDEADISDSEEEEGEGELIEDYYDEEAEPTVKKKKKKKKKKKALAEDDETIEKTDEAANQTIEKEATLEDEILEEEQL